MKNEGYKMNHIRALDREPDSAAACGISWAIMDFLTGGASRSGGKLSLSVISKAQPLDTVEMINKRILAKFMKETACKYMDSATLSKALSFVDPQGETRRGAAAGLNTPSGAEYIAYYKASFDLYAPARS